MEDNFNSFFNPQVETKEIQKNSGQEYNPSAAKGSNNVYQSIIRFIPWWKAPNSGSIMDKWVCYLVDPVTEKGKYVDCPTSVGKDSVLQDMYFKLKKSENVALQKKADIFSRRHSYASLVQVIKDTHNPDLEGKILIWRYGVKIHEKIESELKPILGDAHNPFDPFIGKAFALTITKVSGFNNYDQSKFINKAIPILMPDESGSLKAIDANTDKAKMFEWVKTNSPDLEEKCGYKEWTSETHDYVNNIITAVTGQATVSSHTAAIKNSDTADKAGSAVEDLPQSSDITSTDLSIEDLNVGGGDAMDIDIPDLQKSSDVSSPGISGDLDDIMKGL